MAAGATTLKDELSLNGANVELWDVQSNSATLITIATKLKNVTHAQATWGADIGSTARSLEVIVTAPNTVQISASGTASNILVKVMLLGTL